MTLLELEDSLPEGATAGLPEVTGEYRPDRIGVPLREVKPLVIGQPAGPGFTLDGRLLSWQDWRLRLGFSPREGLVLHPVGVCGHEEDSGILWKHVDERAGAEVRRARRLVISFHVTVANYEYLVYWRFYQDGNIECEVRATGIVVTSHPGPGGPPAHGTLVDE